MAATTSAMNTRAATSAVPRLFESMIGNPIGLRSPRVDRCHR